MDEPRLFLGLALSAALHVVILVTPSPGFEQGGTGSGRALPVSVAIFEASSTGTQAGAGKNKFTRLTPKPPSQDATDPDAAPPADATRPERAGSDTAKRRPTAAAGDTDVTAPPVQHPGGNDATEIRSLTSDTFPPFPSEPGAEPAKATPRPAQHSEDAAASKQAAAGDETDVLPASITPVPHTSESDRSDAMPGVKSGGAAAKTGEREFQPSAGPESSPGKRVKRPDRAVETASREVQHKGAPDRHADNTEVVSAKTDDPNAVSSSLPTAGSKETTPMDDAPDAKRALADESAHSGIGDTTAVDSRGGRADSEDRVGDTASAEKGETLTPVNHPDERAQPAYGANPPPAYPERARELGQEGTVILLVLVGKNGSVAEVEIAESSGHPLLDGSALHTVKREWEFKPGTLNGEPVASRVRVPIRFRLSGHQ